MRNKSQLNAISCYYSKVATENWRKDFDLLICTEEKEEYWRIDKKYKYVANKKKALRKYLKERLGNDIKANQVK